MSSWTRAHDAWIARECEGLEVIEQDGLYVIFAGWCGKYQQEPEKLFKNVYSYDRDPAAAIRAAEAWAAKDSEFRTWTLHRAGTLLGQCTDDGHHYIQEGEDGLCWALYDATGGPE